MLSKKLTHRDCVSIEKWIDDARCAARKHRNRFLCTFSQNAIESDIIKTFTM